MNGHKNRTKVYVVLSVVAIATILETSVLSPIAITTVLITTITSLVFVPRFILSSTDHCKTILICFQTQIEGENFEISESLLLFVYLILQFLYKFFQYLNISYCNIFGHFLLFDLDFYYWLQE